MSSDLGFSAYGHLPATGVISPDNPYLTVDSGSAQQITRSSKSNLAFAFMGLPADRKRNLEIFYAFCRVIDDIADETGPAPNTKYEDLGRWRKLLSQPDDFVPQSELEQEVIQLIQNPDIDRDAMAGIIDGCATDVQPRLYETFDELLTYTYQVASCVGIVSAVLFGAGPDARNYAISLGHALQVTNILRDVGEDWEKEKRIYLPLEDLRRFHYSQEDLSRHIHNPAFVELMSMEKERAKKYYREAAALYARLSVRDRKALAPAVAMHRIYEDILDKMDRDGYQVFLRRYKLSKVKKIFHLLCAWRQAGKQ